MKKIYSTLILFSTTVFAQVGINTTTPLATLDIRSSDQAAPTNTDGIMIPKVNAFPSPSPTAAQRGMMVFLNNYDGQNLPGFYYWIGSAWVSVTNRTAWSYNGDSPPNDAYLGTWNTRPLRFITSGSISGYLGSAEGSNTLFGYQTFQYYTTGTENVGIGYRTLNMATTGFANTGVGYYSLHRTTSGNRNVAIGHTSLFNNTTGSENHGLGWFSLGSNTTGWYNVAIGSLSLRENTTGTANVGSGYSSLYNITSGSYNTAYGHRSGISLGSAVNNTVCIGSAAGFGTTVTNHINIGNTSNVWIGGQVNWGTFSDARTKKNVAEDVKGLDFIRKLRPVTYNFDHKKEFELLNPGQDDNMDFPEKYDIEKIKFSGFIAQEVEAAATKAGYEFSGVVPPPNGKGAYTLRYAEFVVPLVKAIQEQQEYIEKLEARLQKLERSANLFSAREHLSECFQ